MRRCLLPVSSTASLTDLPVKHLHRVQARPIWWRNCLLHLSDSPVIGGTLESWLGCVAILLFLSVIGCETSAEHGEEAPSPACFRLVLLFLVVCIVIIYVHIVVVLLLSLPLRAVIECLHILQLVCRASELVYILYPCSAPCLGWPLTGLLLLPPYLSLYLLLLLLLLGPPRLFVLLLLQLPRKLCIFVISVEALGALLPRPPSCIALALRGLIFFKG